MRIKFLGILLIFHDYLFLGLKSSAMNYAVRLELPLSQRPNSVQLSVPFAKKLASKTLFYGVEIYREQYLNSMSGCIYCTSYMSSRGM